MLKPATFTLLAMGSCVIALLFFDLRALMYFRASVQSWLEGLWWLIAEMVCFANRALYRVEDFLAELAAWSRNEMRWYVRELNRIVFLLVLSLGLTIAIRATISMLIDAQLASASKPRYTKPTSAANGRSEEDLPDLP